MNRAICWLVGHDVDPCDCYATECLRCGLVFDWDDPPRFYRLWWSLRYKARARERLDRFREWIRCPYCGGRFNRHRSDCMPF